MEESRQSESDTDVRDDAASPQEAAATGLVDEAPQRPHSARALHSPPCSWRLVNAFVLVVGALQHDAMTDLWHMRDEI